MSSFSTPLPPQAKANALALRTAFSSFEPHAHSAMVQADPWAADHSAQAQSALARACQPLWARVCACLPGLPGPAALQQAWAVAMARPLWSALLYRSAVQADPALHAEAARLRDLTLQRWQHHHVLQLYARGPDHAIARLLMGAVAIDESAPDLGDHTRLPGSVRLRYRLAWHARQGATLVRLLELAASQKAATDYQRRIELERALNRAMAGGRRFRPLREVEVALLSDKARWVLLAMPLLWPLTMVSSLSRCADVQARADALGRERDRVQSGLDELMEAVRGRRLGEVQAIADRIKDGPVASAMWPQLRTEPWGLDIDFTHPACRPEFGPWVPTSAEALALLQRHSQWELPVWWAMTASEAALWLRGHEPGTTPQRIPPQDLLPMQRSWTTTEQADLIRAGLTYCVRDNSSAWDELSLAELARAVDRMFESGRLHLWRRLKAMPDARPWLELMASQVEEDGDGGRTWDIAQARSLLNLARQTLEGFGAKTWRDTFGHWTVACAGTPAWVAVRTVILEYTTVLEDAVALLSANRLPVDAAALRLAVVKALHESGQWRGRDPVPLLLRWLHLDGQAAPVLLRHGPPAVLLALAGHKATPGHLLKLIAEQAPQVQEQANQDQKSARLTAWRQMLRRVTDAAQLKALVLNPPERGQWAWCNQWLNLPGDDLPLALVLAARRNGWRLIAIHRAVGATAFTDALRRAHALLAPTAPREAAALELVGALGVEQAPHLMRMLAASRRGAAPGHKLDHAYQRHLLPKKSGGSRVICAPDPALKKVQRAVLERLLAPLGQHEAAHGFVAGRGIVGNAQVHVGQAVVVNADVSQCFASVRWPLVLAALRRDLSATLGPVAVSLLCDLCTADGALPTGAPTSPALLNRVLLKTDEVLADAALKRGVRYTRYADDLTFSGEDGAVPMLAVARRTLAQIGLSLDARKTNIFRRGRRQMVTGLVVNDQVSVPRRIRRRLRAAVHRVEQGQAPTWHEQPDALDALKGRLGFVRMVHPQEGGRLLQRLGQALEGPCAAQEKAQ